MAKKPAEMPDKEKEIRQLISDINYDVLKLRQELEYMRSLYERTAEEVYRLRAEARHAEDNNQH